MPANKLLAIDSLGEKISNNFQSGKQPLFGGEFILIPNSGFSISSDKSTPSKEKSPARTMGSQLFATIDPNIYSKLLKKHELASLYPFCETG